MLKKSPFAQLILILQTETVALIKIDFKRKHVLPFNFFSFLLFKMFLHSASGLPDAIKIA